MPLLPTHAAPTPWPSAFVCALQAFLKYAIELQCPLTFPFPGDNVVVLRTGLLRHIDRYMQLLGLVEAPAPAAAAEQAAQPDVKQEADAGLPPVASAEELSSLAGASGAATATGTDVSGEGDDDDDGAASGTLAAAAAAAASALSPGSIPIAPRVQEEKKEALRALWEALRQRVQALRPVERYTVRSVAYRRHLADDADLEHAEADEAARRWPVAWLILRPAKYGPRHQLPAEVRRRGRCVSRRRWGPGA